MSIHESDIFKEVSQRFITKIGTNSEEESFGINASVFKIGDPAEYLYVLMHGNVDIVAGHREGTRYAVNSPGEVFGWSALVEPHVYIATAVCRKETRVIKIPRGLIEHTIIEHPEEGLAVFKNLAKILAKRIRFAYQPMPPET
jgi:CRP-like cAMP-binding protein